MIEHDGGYAHFVITLNRHDSPYGQWSALIGWEINNPRQIEHSMRVDTPLLQGKGGTLVLVTEPVFRKACAKTARIKIALLTGQRAVHTNYMVKQKRNSLRKVELRKLKEKKNSTRYAGLLNRNRTRISTTPLDDQP